MKQQEKAASPAASTPSAPGPSQDPGPAPDPSGIQDRRGIKLPAHARVGGIITPQ